MHPKNPFIGDYDFDRLVQHSPALGTFVFVNDHGTKTIKFGNQNAVKALNAALLKERYGIVWDIPKGNLCPPIPGRLDYLLHVADLVPKSSMRLLDIGTGANLIYPILGTCHFNWSCTASETDLNSLTHARSLIQKNPKLSPINLRHQKFRNTILEHIIGAEDSFDVVVCNPPFYKNAQEALGSNRRKVKNLGLKETATHNFGGNASELWCKGGEEQFLKKMAQESNRFSTRVHWFTALVSQKDHLKSIKRAINKVNPTEVKVVAMGQGNKKSRFIAWTFR